MPRNNFIKSVPNSVRDLNRNIFLGTEYFSNYIALQKIWNLNEKWSSKKITVPLLKIPIALPLFCIKNKVYTCNIFVQYWNFHRYHCNIYYRINLLVLCPYCFVYILLLLWKFRLFMYIGTIVYRLILYDAQLIEIYVILIGFV